MLILLLVLNCLFHSGSPSSDDHGFHLSLCNIQYNESEAALEISLNLVLDDIEAKLEKEGAPKLNLCTEKEHPDGEKYLKKYIEQHFQIAINSKTQKLEWVGKEVTEDLAGVWCYWQILEVDALHQLEIKNTILINELDDQKNIVDIIGPSGKKGYLMFYKGYTEDQLKF